MKRTMLVIMALCMLLCACTTTISDQTLPPVTTAAPAETTVPVETTVAPEPSTEATTVPVEQTTAPVETTAPAETTAPTEPPVLFRSPLTGEPADALWTKRPCAITINNQTGALPLCSLSQAEIVVEILMEGAITRFVGIYDDISGMDHIGSIRSSRPCLVDIAESFDAIYIHHGGSRDGYNSVYELGTANVDAERNAGGYFYREQDRLDNGYDLEHTSFADGDDLMQAAQDLGYDLSKDTGYDYGFQFGDTGSTANGESSDAVTVVFGGYGKTTAFAYDTASKLYTLSEYGEEQVDGNTGDKLQYRNVISIGASSSEYIDQDNLLRLDITLIGEGTGYFACDGKVVPIRWSRAGAFDPFVFTHEDGTPITMGIGKTYIGITPGDGYMEY